MNRRIVLSLLKKEIVDILRDRKTILVMIFVPLVLYPLICFGSMFLASTIISQSTSKEYTIGVENLSRLKDMIDYIEDNSKEYDYKFVFKEVEGNAFESNLEEGKINAYIKDSVSDNNLYYEVDYYASDSDSQTALTMLTTMLNDYNEVLGREYVEAFGLDANSVFESIKYDTVNVASKEESVGYLFGMIVPFLLISSILMGAVYPAIDVTAGEKERGTLETLLTLPVTNLELILSKFLATALVAICAALLNVISMSVMIYYLYKSAKYSLLITEGLSFSVYIPSMLIVGLAAVSFSLLCSAICLMLCIFSKSFKEAQNNTTPLIIIFMFASMGSIIPNLELNSITAYVPVVNIGLLISEVLKLQFDWELIGLVLLSTLLYSIVAMILMARSFSSERILFDDGTSTIRLIEKRTDMKEKQIPGVGDVALIVAISFILMIVVGGIFTMNWGIWGVFLNQLLFALLVLGYCYYIKADFKNVLRLKRPKLSELLAVIPIALGGIIFANGLDVLILKLFPENVENMISSMNDMWSQNSFVINIILTALAPAICEEILFRGFIFGSLSKKYKVWIGIIISSLLFGLFHMTIEQLVCGFCIGALMAYVIYITDSIFCSMLIHFLNNTFSTTYYLKPELFEKISFAFQTDFTMGYFVVSIVAGAIVALLGIAILKLCRKDKMCNG